MSFSCSPVSGNLIFSKRHVLKHLKATVIDRRDNSSKVPFESETDIKSVFDNVYNTRAFSNSYLNLFLRMHFSDIPTKRFSYNITFCHGPTIQFAVGSVQPRDVQKLQKMSIIPK